MKSLFRKKGTPSGHTSPSPMNGVSSSSSPQQGLNALNNFSLEAMVSAGKTDYSAQTEASSSTSPSTRTNRKHTTGQTESYDDGRLMQSKQNNNYNTTANLGYGFHSMAIQVKDAEKSLQFYQEVLGMELIKETTSDDEFSMYFLDFPSSIPRRKNSIKITKHDSGIMEEDVEIYFGSRRGMLQLIHVHGSENDPSFKIQIGTKAAGFTHFSISVPDVEQAKNRMESMHVEIIEDGTNVKGFAVIADPDGYPIQLISHNEGKDDQLREQLAALMSEPQSIISHHQIPNSITSTTTISSSINQQTIPISISPTNPRTANTTLEQSLKQQHERNRITEAFRNARGGSPVSPITPSSPV